MSNDASASPNQADLLVSARLRRTELQNAKLAKELADSTRPAPWYRPLTALKTEVALLLPIAGFLWGVFQYREQQEQNRNADDKRAQIAKDTAEREFMKPWLDTQRDVYKRALSIAAAIPNTPDNGDRAKLEQAFWALYNGEMILLETTDVTAAMVNFGECLDAQHACSNIELNKRCRRLGTAMAESMAATGRMTFEEFASHQFKYASK